jgi:hypothetical protein
MVSTVTFSYVIHTSIAVTLLDDGFKQQNGSLACESKLLFLGHAQSLVYLSKFNNNNNIIIIILS